MATCLTTGKALLRVSRGLSGDSHQDGGQLKVQGLQDIIVCELALVRGCWGVC